VTSETFRDDFVAMPIPMPIFVLASEPFIGSQILYLGFGGALGMIRTCNLLIRSEMLYPLSYERR
jgi:hypothetical protein